MFARSLRKHRTALIALAVYHFVLFFPIAFLGRVISPNDIFNHYEPWASVAGTNEGRVVYAQNASLNDPATSYVTLIAMAREGLATFHWNPYIASGVPGHGSSASAIFTPFVLLALLVPLVWAYTAIIFLKLNAAFFFAYLWLREERLGKGAAALGAIVAAGAGMHSVRWLWQITNATALYPALLFLAARMLHGKRNSVPLMVLIGVAFGISGFPAAIAYGAWLTLLYLVIGVFVRQRGVSGIGVVHSLGRAAVATVIALMIAAPMLVPFAQFIRRSGYLEIRQGASSDGSYPGHHWRSFYQPDRLGNPTAKNWVGDARLGANNAYSEATVYLGLLTLPLVALGFFDRRARRRWFWLGAGALLIACMFGAPVVGELAGSLPGIKFSPLGRLVLLLPLPAAYLAASGVRMLRWRSVMLAAAVIVSFDLALLAGRFYPYLEPQSAIIRSTPTIDFLRAEPGPFRIAPLFDYLWPNTSELVRLEDIRSRFTSERDYRRLMRRIDPTAGTGRTTVLTFNSLQFNFNDPLTHLLGVRYYIEHNSIDIIKWKIFENSRPGVKEEGPLPLRRSSVFERTIRVEEEPFWAIEIPVTVEEAWGPASHLEVALFRVGAASDGRSVWSRRFTKDEANALNKLYIPLRPYARLGEQIRVRIVSHGLRGYLGRGANANAGESPLYYARVMTPLIFDRQLPDGRIFRNLAELPRFRPVADIRKLNGDEFLAARDIDFATSTVITDDPVMVPSFAARLDERTLAAQKLTLVRHVPDEFVLHADFDRPMFIASSEKLTPELQVTVDGRVVRPTEVDLMFAAVAVPAGKHEIVFSRRLARGWWWVAALGAFALLAFVARDVVSWWRTRAQ